jgi:hypothetical protein
VKHFWETVPGILKSCGAAVPFTPKSWQAEPLVAVGEATCAKLVNLGSR